MRPGTRFPSCSENDVDPKIVKNHEKTPSGLREKFDISEKIKPSFDVWGPFIDCPGKKEGPFFSEKWIIRGKSGVISG